MPSPMDNDPGESINQTMSFAVSSNGEWSQNESASAFKILLRLRNEDVYDCSFGVITFHPVSNANLPVVPFDNYCVNY